MSGSVSVLSLIRELIPIVPPKERVRFWALLGLAVFMALAELAITGSVALLAAIFGSPEAVLNFAPILWLREQCGINFTNDSRLLALAVLCIILLLIILKNILTIVQQWHMSLLSERIGAAARSHIFRFYQRAPFLWILQNGVADLNFGLASAYYLATTLATSLNIFTSLLMILTLFLGLVSVSPLPSLLFLTVLALGGGGIIKTIRQFLDKAANADYALNYQISKIGHLALHGLKEMRMYGRENSLFTAYNENLIKGSIAKSRLVTIGRLPVASLEVLGFSTLVGVMLFLVFVQEAGMARISGIMGFLAAAAWRALPVANRLMDAITGLRSGLPYLRKTAELVCLERLLKEELLPLPQGIATPLPFLHEIVLDHVTFRYPHASAPAVQDVTMTIPVGSMVGLVGLSGAGKSTLVNLLTGLMPPESGQVLVDGVPITKDNVSNWLHHIGYVAQSPYILDASLAENVALSRWGEEINRERVLECCRMAALDFLEDLENGIDTILGDRGTRLSGGQAQRVAIARALYSEPALIIFDEATSALDMKNEKAIHETILSLRHSVTMVIIAHRLTTVERCDSIIWMEKGQVHKSGTTEEVLPAYKTLLDQAITQEQNVQE